jgi:hypothetical protein
MDDHGAGLFTLDFTDREIQVFGKSREQKGIGTNFAVRLPELRRRRGELKEKEWRKKKKEDDKKIDRS